MREIENLDLVLFSSFCRRREPRKFGCTYCRRHRHSEDCCWDKNPSRRPKRPSSSTTSFRNRALFADSRKDFSTSESDLLCLNTITTVVSPAKSLTDTSSVLYLVSGAASQMTSQSSVSANFKTIAPSNIQMVNKFTIYAIGKGIAYLRILFCNVLQKSKLQKVSYFRSLKRSLLSVKSLSTNGVRVLFRETSVIFSMHEKTFATGFRCGSFYTLMSICTPFNKAKTASVADLHICLERLCCAAHDGISQMSFRNNFMGIGISKGSKKV